MQKNKLCPGCKEIKNVNNFYESPTRKDGLRCYCKTCEKNKNSTRKYYEKSKEYRQTEKYKTIKKNYYKRKKKEILLSNKNWRDSEKGRYASYKRGAIQRNIEWELSFEEFLLFYHKTCNYCGDEINGIGIDRINNNIGYNIKNCIPCCTICNIMKNNLELNFFINHINKIAKNQKQ